ncbi:MAG TPA: hypothetical protein PLW32_09260 [Chitinophagaceae bacterium]|jgi:hypothetical protein|nr:hypothetical protein [Chitinophagaceae bacterium]
MNFIKKLQLGLLNIGKILSRDEIQNIGKLPNVLACNHDSDCPTLVRICKDEKIEFVGKCYINSVKSIKKTCHWANCVVIEELESGF